MEVNVFLDPGDSIIDICVGSGMQATELAKKKKKKEMWQTKH